MTRLTALAAAATLALAAPATAATLIDFNSLAGGASVTNQFAAQGVLFSTRSGTTISNAAISVYFPCCGTPDPALGNSVNGTGGDQEYLIISFITPVSNLSFGYDNYGTQYLANSIKAYDIDNNLIQTRSATPGVADNALETINFTVSDISYVEIRQSGPGWMFAIDNIRFGGSAVPEPGSWAMLIAGFGLIGAAMRRRIATA
jgi:hypothetical protein